MKKILFPTDFSPTAQNAFIYALKFADSFDAELVLLHVYDLPIVETSGMPETTLEMYDIIEMNKFESFRDELPEMHRFAESNNLGHVKMRNILLYGDVVYNVNKVCTDEGIDMVIMGTNGASGLKETFLGSTSGTLVANAKAPVLVIPAEAEYHPIKNITFTTQFKDKDNDALMNALTIADRFGASLHCVYINSKDDPEDIVERINEWKIYYRERNIEFYNINGEDVEQAILDFMDGRHEDLLVMRKHKRGFFEGLFHTSLTKKMAYHSKVPLLVFHED